MVLADRLLRMQDDERRRMARKLHDTTMQNLAGAAMLIERLRTDASPAGREPHGSMTELQDLVGRSIDELRRLCRLLYPPMLEAIGLVPALKSLTRDAERLYGVTVRLIVTGSDEARRNPHVENALFHIVREALNNVHQHSGSATAELRLMRSLHETVVEIADHGRGLPRRLLIATDNQISALGAGFHGMCARLHPLRGRLQVSSTVHGTTVTARVPTGLGC